MAEESSADRVSRIVADHVAVEGPLLPILHAVQAEFGTSPATRPGHRRGAEHVARRSAWRRVSFYHDFRNAPAGRHVVRLCRAEACQAMGAEALAAEAAKASASAGTRRPRAARSRWSRCSASGLCACGPAAMIDGEAGRPRSIATRLDDDPAEVGA